MAADRGWALLLAAAAAAATAVPGCGWHLWLCWGLWPVSMQTHCITLYNRYTYFTFEPRHGAQLLGCGAAAAAGLHAAICSDAAGLPSGAWLSAQVTRDLAADLDLAADQDPDDQDLAVDHDLAAGVGAPAGTTARWACGRLRWQLAGVVQVRRARPPARLPRRCADAAPGRRQVERARYAVFEADASW
jgi:hypothetical protein